MNKKELDVRLVIEQAKSVLEKTGEHLPQVIAQTNINGKKELAIIVMPFGNQNEKEKGLIILKEFVKNKNVDKYWIIMESWMSTFEKGEKIFRPASRDIDRKEVLIVMEFGRDMTQKGIMIPFNRKDDRIIFGRESNLDKDHSTRWNVYLETEGIDEGHAKFAEMINEAYLRKLAKQMTKKYLNQFNDAKTNEEKINILKQIAKEGGEEIQKQNKTILEGAEDDE